MDVVVQEEVVQVAVECFLEPQELSVLEEELEVLVEAVGQGVPIQQEELVGATVAIGLQQKLRNQIWGKEKKILYGSSFNPTIEFCCEAKKGPPSWSADVLVQRYILM